MEKDDYNSLIPSKISFEDLKQVNQHGIEYWSARELQSLLGYAKWQRFENAIEKAIESCKQSGNDPDHHFAGAGKPIPGGKGSSQVIDDYHLSRFACYLIAQNGNPRKQEIAHAQKYFAIQTRLDFAVFQNHGYKGLYGGLDAKGIHQRKGLKKSQKILDHMGSTELAANLFRATQAEEKLRRDNIQGKNKTNQTHFEVGRKVRKTIKELGGTMPEDLPVAATIGITTDSPILKRLIKAF